MKCSISFRFLFFLLLFYTFLFDEIFVSFFPIFSYEDELIAVCSMPIFFIDRLKKKESLGKGIAFSVLGFVTCGALGSIVYNYQDFWDTSLPDLLICVKFWLCAYFGMRVFRSFNIDFFATRIGFHIKVVAWLFCSLSVLNYSLGLFKFYDFRYGIGANSLFYSHPYVFISHCAFLIILIIGMMPYISHSFFYIVIISISMCTSLRSKAMASAMIFIGIYYYMWVKKSRFSVKDLLPVIPLVIIAGWSQVNYYFISLRETSARSQLLIKSIRIACDHFPLGAGFGTYGSYYSAIHYSPLYYKYGLNNVHGLSREFGSFICDSFWPMILAQFGVFGFVLYIYAIYKLFIEVINLRIVNRFYYSSALGAILYLLLDSTASTAFVHPLSMPIAVWMGILLSKNNRIHSSS